MEDCVAGTFGKLIRYQRHTSGLAQTQLTHPDVAVTTGRDWDKQFLVLENLAPHSRIMAFNNTLTNAYTAIMERVYYHDPTKTQKFELIQRPTRSIFAALHDELVWFRRHARHSSRLTEQEFLSRYTGPKLRAYQRAFDVLRVRGWQLKDAVVRSFVKWEKLINNKRLVPRLISPRRITHQAAIGPYIAPLEHKIYRMLDQMLDSPVPVVQKMFNATEVAGNIKTAWERYADPVCIGLDASRWDQHVSEEALRWEHSVYNLFYHDPHLRKLLDAQVCAPGIWTDDKNGSKIRYKATGRCSGDMNTALGNCLLMCSIVRAYNPRVGQYSLINNGDDCLIICSRKNLTQWDNLDKWFQELGHVLKTEPPVYELEHIEFCQSHPVYNGSAYVMVRNFPSSLVKDSTITHYINSSYPLGAHLGALGDCGLSLSSGLPILVPYYSLLSRVSKTRNPRYLDGTGMVRMARGMHYDVRPITDAARLSFFKAFNVSPELQKEIEDIYTSIQPKTVVALSIPEPSLLVLNNIKGW